MINDQQLIANLAEELDNLSVDLILILGPTASGKTKLAVELAAMINAEIISVDSRQVYRGMDIGTGKDLAEYKDIPYHLIDIINPGEKYNISRFLEDFDLAYKEIKAKGKKVIACGGTGFYLQALIDAKPYAQIPIDDAFRNSLLPLAKDELLTQLDAYALPANFVVDRSSKKRIIRALEIVRFLEENPTHHIKEQATYSAIVYGINPALAVRRQRITDRLMQRLASGMIAEVENLLSAGVSNEELEYYGLEYKYISYYLKGELSYADFLKKLETEIHRYAKRQMTYFRKMEKDGIVIKWF
ncbi:tRNA (adenosine(37)-N6)-dimethylallyltransferase MiaA [Sphingobacterium rhinopitheci]|uniref:tRNA (adenosine(37)-N6)-dimethylallyltransferase MiaA n=1 Tax=Sphingobacterium rhinopitheci TaxID=2781960 RepID=UPI001F51E752|nr:tRNA (adenosine(37)-N6)-dimethylallyltransferase MiaA [Sphingobacterium rhinopitheci]MCI0921918.1 tRNA (adenosine(37)-N6)-dimethylallyltransferase MiaA [Sphingobacterium rhinopitheci]